MGEVLAFVSGKGGTGKTSMCAAIATCLSAMDQKVLCIDLDVGLRNLDIALGLAGEGLLPFDRLCAGDYALEDLHAHPKLPNLFVLTAPVNVLPEEIDKASFCAFVTRAKEHFDFILLDAPAGVGELFSLSAQCADSAIVVTGADKATLRDGTRAAQLLGGVPAKILVNRLSEKLLRKTRATIDDMMDEISLPLLGLVPEDETVTLSAAVGSPLILKSRKGAALACLRVARRLLGKKEPISLK